jgi:hypothetical protein
LSEAVKHPKSLQIANYLAAKKRREHGPVGCVSLSSLQVAAAMMQILPEDIDEGYVLDSTYDSVDSSFVIVLSTIRMSTHDDGGIIYSDATYKFTWGTRIRIGDSLQSSW